MAIPHILHIMLFLSVIAWAMPMIRQANSKLFYFFYIIALTDPLGIIFSYFKVIYSNNSIAFLDILIFFSLKYIVVNKKIFYTSVSFLTAFYIYLLFTPPIYMIYSIILSTIFILVVFLMHTLRFVAATSMINIFHLMLLFYEVTIITKVILLLNYSETAFIYFIATSLFQVLIAIWFTIFKEDNPKLHLNLRNI